ncbi:MAG: AAA family ATPase [Candidatus Altiarchaeota archaeon]|nr:AAA family ATPase [Candidatus Altiarchaeota archaeon]
MVAITVSGKIGSGKSTLAKKLATSLNMEYFSVGRWFREKAEEAGVPIEEFIKNSVDNMHHQIDSHMKAIAKSKNVIIDARLAGWMVPDADLKIFLTAPSSVRAERIQRDKDNRPTEKKREGESWEDEVNRRENGEWHKYKKLYDIDLRDLNAYDLVLNTERISAEDLLEIIELIVKKTIKF